MAAAKSSRPAIGRRVYIHASSYRWDLTNAAAYLKARGIVMPPVEELSFGGVIGSVLITGIVTTHRSPWFQGPAALVLPTRDRSRSCGCADRWGCSESIAIIRIAISVEAFEAIARMLPLGSVGYEAEANERGERLIWLEAAVSTVSARCVGRSESYSDVILRIAKAEIR